MCVLWWPLIMLQSARGEMDTPCLISYTGDEIERCFELEDEQRACDESMRKSRVCRDQG